MKQKFCKKTNNNYSLLLLLFWWTNKILKKFSQLFRLLHLQISEVMVKQLIHYLYWVISIMGIEAIILHRVQKSLPSHLPQRHYLHQCLYHDDFTAYVMMTSPNHAITTYLLSRSPLQGLHKDTSALGLGGDGLSLVKESSKVRLVLQILLFCTFESSWCLIEFVTPQSGSLKNELEILHMTKPFTNLFN